MGEVNTQGILISILVVGLFVAVYTGSILILDVNYDIDGYDDDVLGSYNQMDTLSSTLQKVENKTNDYTPNSGAFDFFSDLWSNLIGSWKFIYGSYRITDDLTDNVVSDFKLMPVFSRFFSSLLIILVIVGIVMLKIYLGRSKS